MSTIATFQAQSRVDVAGVSALAFLILYSYSVFREELIERWRLSPVLVMVVTGWRIYILMEGL